MSDLVTLQQAQTWLNDTSWQDSQMITTLIAAASAAVIDYLGYDPISQTYTQQLSGLATPFLIVPQKNVTAVASITIIPGMTGGSMLWPGSPTGIPTQVDLTQIQWSGSEIYYFTGNVFPRGRKNISATYTAGYLQAALPSQIVQATLITIKGMVNSQAVDPNAASENFAGLLSRSYWPTGAGSVPPAAQTLLNPKRTLFQVP